MSFISMEKISVQEAKSQHTNFSLYQLNPNLKSEINLKTKL